MNCKNCQNKCFLERVYEITVCNYCNNFSNFEAVKNCNFTVNTEYIKTTD